LYCDRTELASNISAICHAALVHGKNSGTPRIDKSPILTAFARQVLAANLQIVPDAMIIPLGNKRNWPWTSQAPTPVASFVGFPIPRERTAIA
jgi:hypothetical protein